MVIRALIGVVAAVLAQDQPMQTLTAFNARVSYEYSCAHDVYTFAIGAQNQDSTAGASTLYWEIRNSGQAASQTVEGLAMVNTLQVPSESVEMRVYRPCSQQSLYLWPSHAASTLPDGSVILRFSDSVEQPLTESKS